MQLKALLGLGVLAAGVGFAAFVTLQESNAESGPEELGNLFDGLGSRINDVAQVQISKEGESLTFSRSKDDPSEWTVASIGGYPAKFEPIKRAIVRLADMEIREKKTNKPENYEKLGVSDPEAEGSSSLLVTLQDASGDELASAILGETSYRGRSSTTYVRRQGEDRVYLCDGRIDAQPTLRTWIETVALKLENDRVQSVTISHTDGETVQVERSAENHTQFAVANVPPGRELKYDGIANGVASALASLNFDDVCPASEVDFTTEPLTRSRFVCHDGLVVVIETARFEDQTWARISSSYEAPPASETAPQTADGAEEGEEGEGHSEDDGHDHGTEAAATPDPALVRAEAEEMAGRHALWAYALPSYKADAIAKRMVDLLNELPEEGEETALDPGGLPAMTPDTPSPEELQKLLEQAGLGEGGASADDGK